MYIIRYSKREEVYSVLLGCTRHRNSPKEIPRTGKMPSWKYTNLLLVKVDIEEENGGEGASKGQYGIYQGLGIQVFRKELLEFQCSKWDRSCIEATRSVAKGKQWIPKVYEKYNINIPYRERSVPSLSLVYSLQFLFIQLTAALNNFYVLPYSRYISYS